MKREWLWGPGRIDPVHRDLSKRAYLERLGSVRASYLGKLLRNLKAEDIQYVCRLEKTRFSLLAALDEVSELDFQCPQQDVPACRDCPNMTTCEASKVCDGWSLADFAAHLLTHEEKNVDPEVNETLQHMAEHEETHLHQVQSIVGRMRRLGDAGRTSARSTPAAMDVEVRASAIEGLGVFAARVFRAGDRIRRINVVREITPEAPLREDLGERQDHCDYPDGRVVLLGYPDRHVNHSCDPSAYVLYEGDAVWLVARRAMAAGDEITCDYNINIAGGTSWPCRCRAARCRGATGGDYFLLPAAIQEEYRPLLADWFVRRHRDRLEALEHERHAAGG